MWSKPSSWDGWHDFNRRRADKKHDMPHDPAEMRQMTQHAWLS
jgi:hypothetical protein